VPGRRHCPIDLPLTSSFVHSVILYFIRYCILRNSPRYTECPSCRNPPNLSWLGTGTDVCWLAYQVAWPELAKQCLRNRFHDFFFSLHLMIKCRRRCTTVCESILITVIQPHSSWFIVHSPQLSPLTTISTSGLHG